MNQMIARSAPMAGATPSGPRARLPEGWPTGSRLSPHVVDVVSCPLDLTSRDHEALGALLSTEERNRAARLITPEAREGFVAARGRLRQLLGLLSKRSPDRLRIGIDARGKPRLEGDTPPRLRFNVAHSGRLLVCAVTLDHEVGIDVEREREDVDCDRIARRFFAAEEAQALSALPPRIRRQAFFACWTRKEAVVKATGAGLARPLDSFAVSVDPTHAALLAADASLGSPSDWSLLPIPLPPPYQGTVAIRHPRARLRPWLGRVA
jgi:4'-phosphopantetheinyl transferase